MGRYYRRKGILSFISSSGKGRSTKRKQKADGMAFVIGAVFAVGMAISLVNCVSAIVAIEAVRIFIKVVGIAFLCLAFSVFLLFVKNTYSDKTCTEFVTAHSVALKKLTEINNRYTFQSVPSLDMSHSYDNENIFSDLTPEDYLTYQLVYIAKDVETAIKKVAENNRLYTLYKAEVDKAAVFEQYDTTDVPKNRELLRQKERTLFYERVKHPTTIFQITVNLRSENMAGRLQSRKRDTFSEGDVVSILQRLQHKQGNFYLDAGIWQSLCHVERAKVTNKMRFAIYNRDGNRCRLCGSRDDLQIDHIYPIAKGGKSTIDNLQTLCRRCNTQKSDSVTYSHKNPVYNAYGVSNGTLYTHPTNTEKPCPICKVGRMVVKEEWQHGKIYACSNYPSCRHMERK